MASVAAASMVREDEVEQHHPDPNNDALNKTAIDASTLEMVAQQMLWTQMASHYSTVTQHSDDAMAHQFNPLFMQEDALEQHLLSQALTGSTHSHTTNTTTTTASAAAVAMASDMLTFPRNTITDHVHTPESLSSLCSEFDGSQWAPQSTSNLMDEDDEAMVADGVLSHHFGAHHEFGGLVGTNSDLSAFMSSLSGDHHHLPEMMDANDMIPGKSASPERSDEEYLNQSIKTELVLPRPPSAQSLSDMSSTIYNSCNKRKSEHLSDGIKSQSPTPESSSTQQTAAQAQPQPPKKRRGRPSNQQRKEQDAKRKKVLDEHRARLLLQGQGTATMSPLIPSTTATVMSASIPAPAPVTAPPSFPYGLGPVLAKHSGVIVDASGSLKVPLPVLAKNRPLPTATPFPSTHVAKQQRKTAHNVTEKKYRNSINVSIENLKAAVPALNAPEASEWAAQAARKRKKSSKKRAASSKDDDDSDDDSAQDDTNIIIDGVKVATKDNKATVIRKATEYIDFLKEARRSNEEENDRLRSQVMALREMISKLTNTPLDDTMDGIIMQETSPPNSGGAASPVSSSEPSSPPASSSSGSASSKLLGLGLVASWASFFAVNNHETHAPGRVLSSSLGSNDGVTSAAGTYSVWMLVAITLVASLVYTLVLAKPRKAIVSKEFVKSSGFNAVNESPQKAYQMASRVIAVPAFGLSGCIVFEWIKWMLAGMLPTSLPDGVDTYEAEMACLVVESDLAGGNPSSTFASRLYVTLKALNLLYRVGASQKDQKQARSYLVCAMSLESLARQLPPTTYTHGYLTDRATKCLHVATPCIIPSSAQRADVHAFFEQYFAVTKGPVSISSFTTAFRHHQLLNNVSFALPYIKDVNNKVLPAEAASELTSNLQCILNSAMMAQDTPCLVLCYLIGGMTGVLPDVGAGLSVAVEYYGRRYSAGQVQDKSLAIALCGFDCVTSTAHHLSLNADDATVIKSVRKHVASVAKGIEEVASKALPVSSLDGIFIVLGMTWCLASKQALGLTVENHAGCALLVNAMKAAVRHVAVKGMVELVKHWERVVRGD